MSSLTPSPRLKDQYPAFIQIAAATLLLQFVLISICFPITQLLTQTPMFRIDGGFHWYQIKTALNLAKTTNIVGYDPYFNAGYPGGATYNWSARGAAVMAVLLQPWFTEIVSYKIYAFASALIAPLCVTIALFSLGADSRGMLIGTVLGLFLWWTSVFRWFDTAGMVSFVAGSYLSLIYLVAVIRYLRGGRSLPYIVGLSVAGAIGLFYHPYFPVPVAFAMMGYLVFFWHEFPWRKVPGLVVVSMVSVSANFFWLRPLSNYKILREPREYFQSINDINIVWQELLGRWQGHAQGSKSYFLLGLLCLWGWFAIKDQYERKMARAFALSGAALIVFAAVGASVQTIATRMQPNRFAPVGYLLLIVPATCGLLAMIDAVKTISFVPSLAARVSLVPVVLLGLYLCNEVRTQISSADIPHYGATPPEIKNVGDYSDWVLDWLKNNTTTDGRVLFETSKARIYDGAHMAGYYAYTSDRDFIGGPYVVTSFTGFWDGFLFDKPIDKISHDHFERYMDVYNVGWVIVFSDKSKAYLNSHPSAIPVGEFKQLRAYKLQRNLTYFMEGDGHISAREHNKVVFSDLSGPAVLLKFHLVPGLKTEPATTLIPVQLADDPTPFVKIVDPPKKIRLYFP
jgi:hypothetical protein